MMAKANLSDGASVLSRHLNASTQSSMISISKNLMRHLAAPLLGQMGIVESRTTPVQLLDSACGTGVVSQEVQGILPRDVLEHSTITSADHSEVLVNLVKERIEKEGWINTQCKVLDAMDTGLPGSSFSHVAIALGLHLIPDPDKVLKDCRRLLKNGGVFGATTFPQANFKFWASDTRAAFASFDFDAPFPDEMPTQTHDSGKWYDPQWVEQHLREEGFEDVQVMVDPGRYHVESAKQFVEFFGLMLPYIVNNWWTEEQRKEHPVEEVKGLIEAYLAQKYEGKGWDIEWEVIVMTGVVRK